MKKTKKSKKDIIYLLASLVLAVHVLTALAALIEGAKPDFSLLTTYLFALPFAVLTTLIIERNAHLFFYFIVGALDGTTMYLTYSNVSLVLGIFFAVYAFTLVVVIGVSKYIDKTNKLKKKGLLKQLHDAFRKTKEATDKLEGMEKQLLTLTAQNETLTNENEKSAKFKENYQALLEENERMVRVVKTLTDPDPTLTKKVAVLEAKLEKEETAYKSVSFRVTKISEKHNLLIEKNKEIQKKNADLIVDIKEKTILLQSTIEYFQQLTKSKSEIMLRLYKLICKNLGINFPEKAELRLEKVSKLKQDTILAN